MYTVVCEARVCVCVCVRERYTEVTLWTCSSVVSKLMIVTTFSLPFRWWRFWCVSYRSPCLQLGRMDGSGHTDTIVCQHSVSKEAHATAGNSSVSRVHSSFSNWCSTPLSHFTFVKTHPGDSEVILKWCNFLMSMIFFILVAKKSVQLKVRLEQWCCHLLSIPAERSYSRLMCWRLVLWNVGSLPWSSCTGTWTSQSTNSVRTWYVLPEVMLMCLLVRVRQTRYCSIQLFLFCPAQLSACR